MTRIRVLFADDQLPYDEPARNEAVKRAILEQIGERLRQENKDPESAYAEDFAWFKGLCQHLSERFIVIPARTFADAKAALAEPEKFDAAVIDLSWSGDAQLPLGRRHNVGLELLEILQQQNDRQRGYKPVLAFSQNFRNDPQLMSLVLDRGALPVPKTYTDTGHQALASAISYLAKVRPPGSAAEDPTLAAARVSRTGTIVAAAITGLLGAAAAVLVSVFA